METLAIILIILLAMPVSYALLDEAAKKIRTRRRADSQKIAG